jgi:hypothetical protein
MVANYYKYGPATNVGVRSRILQPSDTAGNWYIADNFVYGNPAVTADNWNGGVQGGYATFQYPKRRLSPFATETVTTHTPDEAYELVLAHGGASFPSRDTIDARIVNEVRTGTATYGGLWGAGKGIIDSQDSLGGWPVLASAPAPPDADHDGIPDDWESANSLDPDDSTDGALIGPDGYSNLETYLHQLVAQTTGVAPGGGAPADFHLLAAYPNPFNPRTSITCSLPERGRVTIDVVNLSGQKVAVLADQVAGPGRLDVPFVGSGLASGVYLCRLTTTSGNATIKLMLMK